MNYKNAYEYWNEQRLALNKEVQTATQQVMDKLPLGSINPTATTAIPPTGGTAGTGPQASAAGAGTPLGGAGSGGQPALGTLFLQVTVEDLGICLPMNPLSQVRTECVQGVSMDDGVMDHVACKCYRWLIGFSYVSAINK